MNHKVALELLIPAWLCTPSWVEAESHSAKVTVTAYNATRYQTDSTPWIGACNKRLKSKDRPVAVSRDLFKRGLDCGTKVAIEGHREKYIVMDKMNARHRQRIDLFMGKSLSKTREFGAKRTKIWWHTNRG